MDNLAGKKRLYSWQPIILRQDTMGENNFSGFFLGQGTREVLWHFPNWPPLELGGNNHVIISIIQLCLFWCISTLFCFVSCNPFRWISYPLFFFVPFYFLIIFLFLSKEKIGKDSIGNFFLNPWSSFLSPLFWSNLEDVENRVFKEKIPSFHYHY